MADVRAFLEQASRDDDPNMSVGIELRAGRLIGCGGLRNIVPKDSAEVSVVIGEPDVWGLGYAREAMDLLLQFGFEHLGLRTIWLVTRTETLAACACSHAWALPWWKLSRQLSSSEASHGASFACS